MSQCCSPKKEYDIFKSLSSAVSNFKELPEEKRTLILTLFSGVLLFFSAVTDIRPLGVDLAWAAIIICGGPMVLHSAKMLIFHRNIRAGLLISIALISCIIIGEYFAAGEIAFIMTLGEMLEDYTVRRSRAGLKNLIDMQPATARVYRNGEYTMIDAQEVVAGDVIRVNAGEAIPVDGVITEGTTSINQAIMTGESIPVDKTVGDTVFSATTNTHGSILLEATKVGADSSIAKMIAMIAEAETKKAPIVGIMDKCASYLVVAAVVLAFAAWLFTGDIIRAITVLVVFCPCALVLATPTAIAAGIGNATKHGVIIKSGKALEQLSSVAHIAFDKTGTLTHGTPSVLQVTPTADSGLTDKELLELSASAEMHSEHPLGVAVVHNARKQSISLAEPESFTVIPGKGVEAVVNGKTVVVGNTTLLHEKDIALSDTFAQKIEQEAASGHTVIGTAINGVFAGYLTLADTLRPDSASIVSQLKTFGQKITLLTGDNKPVAAAIGAKLGIRNIEAELLPADKVTAVEKLERAGERVCMVGDGINDAPALKTAYVGIAMAGIGSDIAADSADIVLVKDEIDRLPYVMSLSKVVAKKIRVNIGLALAMNFGAIILAMTGLMGPVIGALFHNVSSVLVVLNAAMLLRFKR